ncbi:hypothetical protein [Fictibacillus sp. NRS-1165]|uniref:hypothetical protein n=1 Tax=Fictibacillus sp. NRS-1165 TaxID=3144463 RepID=UPI003D1C7901
MHPDWKKKIVITGMAAILNVGGTGGATAENKSSGHGNDASGKLNSGGAEKEPKAWQ